MLCDKDILAVMQTGELQIKPFNDSQLRPAAISLHLGKEILVPKPTKLIDLNAETPIDYYTHNITAKKPFILQPQQFVLGHTEEVISVGTSLGFIIEGRSTLARLGISVEQSATIVDPGHTNRPITLEIYNCGPSPVALYRGLATAKALVFRLSSTANTSYDDYSRYAKQTSGVSKPMLQLKSSDYTTAPSKNAASNKQQPDTMACPRCQKTMSVIHQDSSYNYKNGTNYRRVMYSCSTDDVWFTTEIPI